MQRKFMHRNVIGLSICLLMLAFTGCAKPVGEQREPVPPLVWPLAPDQARIRLINVVSRPEHLRIAASPFQNFVAALAGKTENRRILRPYGLQADEKGSLYVVDNALKVVHFMDPSNNEYYQFPKGETTFESPIGIAIDTLRDRVFVSDSEQGCVKMFREQGKKYVGDLGRGVFERPTGLAINRQTSELLVVDTLSANILRYDLVDLQLKAVFGGSGTENGQFNYPTNICIGPEGRIYVTDSLNFRIQVFSAQGTFLETFGEEGDEPGYFTRPRGVATDSVGNVYVVDGLFDNVQVFDRDHRLLMYFGNHGNDYGEFWLPNEIFIASNDMIYISDAYNGRLQIFGPVKDDSP